MILSSAKRYRFLTKAQLADEPAPSGAASFGDGFEALGEALEGSDCLGGLGAFSPARASAAARAALRASTCPARDPRASSDAARAAHDLVENREHHEFERSSRDPSA
jgi:hypothetical protein